MTLRSFHLVADKIAEADYFLGRMNETSEEFDVFRFNYSAFVSAARSITFVLQTAMHDVPGFAAWYAPRQELLKADPVARHFVESRNNVLKTGVNPITLGGYGGPGVERQNFWGLHPGDALKGAMRVNYEKVGLERDVRDIARSYLIALLALVRDCFVEFRLYVDPLAIYTESGMRANGWTPEDVEEQWGLPRGYASVACDSDEGRAWFLNYFRSSCDEVDLDRFFEAYGVEPIPDVAE